MYDCRCCTQYWDISTCGILRASCGVSWERLARGQASLPDARSCVVHWLMVVDSADCTVVRLMHTLHAHAAPHPSWDFIQLPLQGACVTTGIFCFVRGSGRQPLRQAAHMHWNYALAADPCLWSDRNIRGSTACAREKGCMDDMQAVLFKHAFLAFPAQCASCSYAVQGRQVAASSTGQTPSCVQVLHAAALRLVLGNLVPATPPIARDILHTISQNLPCRHANSPVSMRRPHSEGACTSS